MRREQSVWFQCLVVVVQSPSCVDFAEHQASLSLTISWSLPKFTSITSVMPSSHLILCHPLFLLPSIFHSIMVFSKELAVLIRWPECWSFSFSISPFSDYSGLISFKIDWFDLLVVQGAPQFESINSLVLYLLYGPPLKTVHDYWKDYSLDYIDLCWQSDVFAFLIDLSRFVIAFLSRSKCLLISWLQSPSTVVIEPKKRKLVTCFCLFPFYLPEVKGLDTMILVFLILSFKLAFSRSSFTSRDSLVPLYFLPLEWYHPHIWGCWYFSQQSWFQLIIHPACISHDALSV